MNVQTIHHHADTGLLEIVWEDNTTQKLASSLLREKCQCASCKANRIKGLSQIIPDSVKISGINPIGVYGIQLIFNDGHDRGIYPWVYLRSLHA